MSLKEMLESAIKAFGTGDIITVMLSQRLDKEIVKEQMRMIERENNAVRNNKSFIA